jgi:hypothetical protein
LPPPPTVPPIDAGVSVDVEEAPRALEVAAAIRQAAITLAGLDPAQVGDAELLALVEALAPVIDRLTAVQAVAVGQVDARGAAITREGLLTDAWLQLVSRRAGGDRRHAAGRRRRAAHPSQGAGGGAQRAVVVVRGPGDLPQSGAPVRRRIGRGWTI